MKPWISECRLERPPGRLGLVVAASLAGSVNVRAVLTHDYLWLRLGRFHPFTSDGAAQAQVGLNLHVVCVLVNVFCVIRVI